MANPSTPLTEDVLNGLLLSAKTERETSELHARSPAHLSALMSHIRARQPKERFDLKQGHGAYGSSFDISKSTIYLSVFTNSENDEPISKDLTLTCSLWHIFHYYLTGAAGSGTVSVSVEYSDMSAQAYVTEYDDPGQTMAEWTHGRIGAVFQTLLEDLGGGSVAGAVEMIEVLLGNDAKAYLDAKVEDYGSLREIIDKKLEGDEELNWYVFSSSFHVPFRQLSRSISRAHTQLQNITPFVMRSSYSHEISQMILKVSRAKTRMHGE
jgi:hypothetical protein